MVNTETNAVNQSWILGRKKKLPSAQDLTVLDAWKWLDGMEERSGCTQSCWWAEIRQQGLRQKQQQPGVQDEGEGDGHTRRAPTPVLQWQTPPLPDGSFGCPQAPVQHCRTLLALGLLLPFIQLTECPLPSQAAWYDGS